jgi:hypothetical protein
MAIYDHIEAENVLDFQGSISKTEVKYLPSRQLVIVAITQGGIGTRKPLEVIIRSNRSSRHVTSSHVTQLLRSSPKGSGLLGATICI